MTYDEDLGHAVGRLPRGVIVRGPGGTLGIMPGPARIGWALAVLGSVAGALGVVAPGAAADDQAPVTPSVIWAGLGPVAMTCLLYAGLAAGGL